MSTTLEILQAYPLGTLEVEVMNRFSGNSFRAWVRGLQVGAVGVEVEKEGANGYTSFHDLEYVTPVLRSFEDLCIPLEDGTVPAVEVAKIIGPDKYDWARARAESFNGHKYIVVFHHNGSELFTLYNDDYGLSECSLHDGLRAIAYLRSKHFAVNLTPDQYIRKTA
ncbi:hypothetical protein [Hymenobacter metallicola]|uniref:Uncharacterized protein n=1 Tax=Hymenobacter metallicola TaxID=2563114 RepID=A0A4Z0QJS6_9BACT|nr:hypothetical protein [Hymenobacter metallicola]TGE29776.1 hypothetical protein E5K02_10040 [Hymenobacter metallicola]